MNRRQHAIQNDIANTDIGFIAMAKYRLYRRAGFEIRWESGGATLARRNTSLLIARGRFGGLLTDGAAAAVMDDAKS
ncbi:MAG: hypothetical protein AB7N71_04855 [Phycisphaerae bacterium]